VTQQVPIRVGLMGFGQIGRQLYRLAAASGDIEIVAIADIGDPRILHYLLCSEAGVADTFTLEGNFLVNPAFRTRMLPIDRPAEMPWDVLGVDIVIDATGIYRERSHMADHLDNGAGRVILRSLPADEIDRIVIPGVNSDSAEASDRMVSAGSSTTSALCLLLDSLSRRFPIDCASMTTVHSYTSDQALQDYAGSDFRRSRSAAENIIPNTHEAGNWLGKILPDFEGRVMTWALNVPIHQGCLLDVNLVVGDAAVTVDMINDAMRDAATRLPGIVGVAEDPIVSSDVIGSSLSLLYDLRGTIKAGATVRGS
jgi:glyceraldehyde 3-phosphate dehydrogenase